MEDGAVLYVIEGDYGLVSLDPACIQSILYTKIAKAPIRIRYVNSVRTCAFYSAPTLKIGHTTISDFEKMVFRWKSDHTNIDEALTPKQISETLALKNYVTSKMKPLFDFMYWVDQRNCDEFIGKWFMKALPFPFNYSYTKRKKAEAAELIETLYPLDSDLEVVKEFVIKAATQCLATISTRLGKAKFFFGDNPTSLDVVVYAHIAPFIKLPFPANDITSVMSMWPNLAEFVKRIDNKYFTGIKRETKYLAGTEMNRHQNDEDVSYMAVFILFISASSLVLGFALRKGIINISR